MKGGAFDVYGQFLRTVRKEALNFKSMMSQREQSTEAIEVDGVY